LAVWLQSRKIKDMGMGKILIIAGIVLIAAGLLWHFLDLGRLPGDFRIRRGNVSFYFPLTTCILLSILLSLIVYFFRK
jgi:uncharacterized membrane protein YidH (DUF202 family)